MADGIFSWLLEVRPRSLWRDLLGSPKPRADLSQPAYDTTWSKMSGTSPAALIYFSLAFFIHPLPSDLPPSASLVSTLQGSPR